MWGVVVMSAAGVTSAAGLLVSRFMLGVMEAGIIYILMNETIKKKKKTIKNGARV